MKQLIFTFLLVLVLNSSYSQELTVGTDSANCKNSTVDTTGFYGDLYRYSKDKKYLFMLYQAFFNVSELLGKQDLSLGDVDSISYKGLEGKRIRSIKIISYGPFGNSINDTIGGEKNSIEKIGNSLHFKTKEAVIKNNLLFNEGDTIDLLRISESERLIRSSQYIRDARILLKENNGMVDVVVYTLDLWTLKIGLTLTGTKVKIGITAYNMFGVGHRFRNKTSIRYKNIDDNQFENEGSYFVPNIGSTFISSEVFYRFSQREDLKGISVQRKFYSALTKYAGGADFLKTELSDSIRLREDGYDAYQSDFNYASVWGARSFDIKDGNTIEERSSKFVVSGGYSQIRYNSVITESELVNEYYEPYDLYLLDFGFSNRKYYTDKYVLQLGEREDIPTGRILKFTTGYQVRNNKDDYYAGVALGGSGYLHNKSYLSYYSQYGTFIKSGGVLDGVFKTDFLFYSRLYGKTGWKMRWFANANFTTGIKRKFTEYIKLSEENWIPGYKNLQPQGNSRLVFNFTSVLFNSFEWIGFKFSPVVFGGMGMMSNELSSLLKAKIYPGIGGGFVLNNVYLVQSEIRLFFGYYYGSPEDDFRVSSFNVWDFNFRDYDFSKPETIKFE